MGLFARLFKRKKKMVDKINVWEDKLQLARKLGVKIGDKTRLNCSLDAFGTEPYLIKIGEDCLISRDVLFITHDGGIKVLNSLGYFKSEKMDKIAPIVIGNNVYIGTGAYIMQGVKIGNNVIIGARALVTHNIPDNVVVVGSPARIIKSINDYYQSGLNKGWYYPTGKLSKQEKEKYFLDNNKII